MSTSSSQGSNLAVSETCTDCCEDGLASSNASFASAVSAASILLETGQFIWRKRLLSVDALGGKGWSFDLNYLGGNGITGILGPGFDYRQNAYLIELAGGDVELSGGNNTSQVFVSLGGGSYSSAGNETSAMLKRTGEGTGSDEFQLTAGNGNVSRFFGFHASIATPGRLKSTTDRFGNGQTLTWTQVGGKVQLANVTDSYGRTITYKYYGPEADFQLREIEDFLGRKLNFQYKPITVSSVTHYHLVAAVLPSVLKASEGNTFPGGTACVFEYDSANTDEARKQDLIKIWYPNEVAPYLDETTRTVDVDAVYADAAPRYIVEYGQDDLDIETYGRVLRETVGDPGGCVGGAIEYAFDLTGPFPDNIIDPADPIVSRTTMTDRNGNVTVHDFNANGMRVRLEVQENRDKNSLQTGPYVTWTKYNGQNQVLLRVMPEGDSLEKEYETGTVSGITGTYIRRRGLLLRETRKPGNWIGVASRGGSNDQTELTRRYFYDPLFNRRCAVIEQRGNPINPDYAVSGGATINGARVDGGYYERGTQGGQPAYVRSDGAFWIWTNGSNWRITVLKGVDGSGYFQNGATITASTYTAQGSGTSGTATVAIPAGSAYWTPQNGGTTPTDADRSRFASITYFDYQKNTAATIKNDSDLQTLLGLNATEIQALIDHVDNQMKATDGTGGLPNGFQVDLGDINGDGTGDGASSGLDEAPMLGNVVKVEHPAVRQLKTSTGMDPWEWDTQTREEIFTVNQRGQVTTHTDAEGNLTVYMRYPENDPEGDGRFVSGSLSNKQYGRLKETHVDADPNDVMSLLGADADLVDFVPGIITRTNTPGEYQDLTTRHEGASGCSTCSYDALGNVLTTTDARGFTTTFDRNELGEVYRVTSAKPYEYKTETQYDANRNVIRVDTEDRVVAFTTDDPSDAAYAKFVPTGNLADGVAHIPTKAGPGGTVRPGWFTNLFTYDLLDNRIEEDIDATGSQPASLVTRYCYDANQNLIKIIKPLGNTVEYDYDERNLRIAERVGRDVPAYSDNVLESSPVAYWQLSDASGTTATDSSGNEVNGTFTGGFTLDQTGAVLCRCACDKAVKLNGTTGFVDAGTDTNLDVTGAVTLEAWVNIAAFPTSGNHAAIVSKGSDGAKTAYYLGIHNDGGTLKLIAGADDTLNAASWTIAGWSTAEWVHVAAVYDADAGEWQLLFNGDEKVATSSVKAPVVSGGKLFLGAYDNNSTTQRFLNATIDQIAIYPVALTEAQLELHYKLATSTTTSSDYYQGAVTITSYDGNGNMLQRIGATDRNAGVGGAATSLTATIEDAFSCGADLVHTGDYALENTYDGFNRVIDAIDAVGNVVYMDHDPDGRVVDSTVEGPVGGTTIIVRTGGSNVPLAGGITRFDEAGRAYESQRTVMLATGATLPSSRAVTHTGGGLATNSTTNNHTGSVTLTSAGASYVLSRTVFDRLGRVTDVAQDNAGVSTMVYDGAGRVLSATDALGNVVESTYDGNSNVIFTQRTEKCTITAPTVADEIFRSAARYDALNRLVFSASQGADGRIDDALVPGPAGAACSQATVNTCTWPIDSSTLFTLVGYDSRGNATVTIDPKGNTSLATYDGASRPIDSRQLLRQDGEGNNPPPANQTFTAPGGNARSGGAVIRTQSLYDANSRVVQLIDDRGGATTYRYDTLDRQTEMIFHDGSTRITTYDDAGDVLTYTDENGSVFAYTYDALGRRTACAITPASGVAGNNGESERGTTGQSFQYDGLSRTTRSIDTTKIDNASAIDATCVMVYDSLGRVLEDSQTFGGNTRDVTNNAFTSYPATQFTFPDDREITNTYDVLYRRTLVEETSGGADIAAWEFFGPGRVAEVQLGTPGSGLICTFMNNARTHSAVQANVANPTWGDSDSDRLGYDGSGRMITKRFLAGGIDGGTHAYNDPASIVGFTASFDKASNKLYERHLHAESRSHLYQPFNAGGVPQGGYDSIDRLRQYQRGTLETTGGLADAGGGAVATPISLPNAKEQQTYALDGLGNWKNTTFTPVGDALVKEVRDHNYLNQITATKEDSDPKVPFEYDGTAGASNGNLKNDDTRGYLYDALNRLVQVDKDPNGTPTLIGTYTYDAMGRRIRKAVTNGGLSGSIPNGTTDFLYAGWRVMEERNPFGGGGATDTTTKQYVWGIYLDELIQQKQVAALNNFSANAVLYPLQDLLYRTTGLADSAGVVGEAYDCDAYGNTLIFRNAGTPPGIIGFEDADTQVGFPTCEAIFTGQRWDAESLLYSYRMRIFAPALGRFCQHDPIGYFDSASLYNYVRNRPQWFVDPLGMNVFDDIGEGIVGVAGGAINLAGGVIKGGIDVAGGVIKGGIDIASMAVGIPGSVLSGDIFSAHDVTTTFPKDQCEFLLTITGWATDDAGSQNFRSDVLKTPFFNSPRPINSPQYISNQSAWLPSPLNFGDIVQSALLGMGAIDIPAIQTAQQIQAFADAAKANGCKCPRIYVVAHSQGTAIFGAATRLLSKNVQGMITFVGIGGQVRIQGGNLAGSENFENAGDIVPVVGNLLPAALLSGIFNGPAAVIPTVPQHAALSPHGRDNYIDTLTQHFGAPRQPAR